jgi:hypothetical protein
MVGIDLSIAVFFGSSLNATGWGNPSITITEDLPAGIPTGLNIFFQAMHVDQATMSTYYLTNVFRSQVQ